jgi:hypothetical protein
MHFADEFGMPIDEGVNLILLGQFTDRIRHIDRKEIR